MNRKKAIKILIEQKNKLSNIADNNWIVQTAEYAKLFFGENSTQYKSICKFNFVIEIYTGMDSNDWDKIYEFKKNEVSKYIDNCIDTIQKVGLYKPPKVNFLQRFSNISLTGIFIPIISGLCLLTYKVGQWEGDIKNIELRQKINYINDSLSVSATPKFHFPKQISTQDTAKNKEKNK